MPSPSQSVVPFKAPSKKPVSGGKTIMPPPPAKLPPKQVANPPSKAPTSAGKMASSQASSFSLFSSGGDPKVLYLTLGAIVASIGVALLGMYMYYHRRTVSGAVHKVLSGRFHSVRDILPRDEVQEASVQLAVSPVVTTTRLPDELPSPYSNSQRSRTNSGNGTSSRNSSNPSMK